MGQQATNWLPCEPACLNLTFFTTTPNSQRDPPCHDQAKSTVGERLYHSQPDSPQSPGYVVEPWSLVQTVNLPPGPCTEWDCWESELKRYKSRSGLVILHLAFLCSILGPERRVAQPEALLHLTIGPATRSASIKASD